MGLVVAYRYMSDTYSGEGPARNNLTITILAVHGVYSPIFNDEKNILPFISFEVNLTS